MPSDPPDDDKLHEECGVFGLWDIADAAAVTALGLHALQHRGQEATGIVSFDGAHFHSHRGMGLVGDNFSDARVIATAAGQPRGRPQPLRHHRRHRAAQRAAALCGFRVRRASRSRITATSPTPPRCAASWCAAAACSSPPPTSEVFIHLIAISLYSTVVDRLIDALKQVVGAYSLIALTNEALIGVRDPLGVRPLILGRLGRRRLGAGERDLRAGDRRRRVRARRRAGRDRGDRRCRRAQHPPVRAASGRGSACSNTSTSRAPIRWSRARRSTPRASASAPNLRARAMCPPT